MRGAFLKVYDALDLTYGPGPSATDFAVTKIVQLARSGEWIPQKLCARVMQELKRRV
jgi:hypothetical protein